MAIPIPENTPKNFLKTPKNNNLLKTKRIFKPKYKLSRGPVFTLLCQGAVRTLALAVVGGDNGI